MNMPGWCEQNVARVLDMQNSMAACSSIVGHKAVMGKL